MTIKVSSVVKYLTKLLQCRLQLVRRPHRWRNDGAAPVEKEQNMYFDDWTKHFKGMTNISE